MLHADSHVSSVRVLLVAEEEFLVRGLRLLLQENGIDVVDSTAASETVAVTRARKPDVVMIHLGSMARADAKTLISSLAPSASVLALTPTDDDELVVDCVAAGARGVVRRDAAMAEIVDSVDAAAKGHLLLCGRAAGSLTSRLRVLTDATGNGKGGPIPAKSLSCREEEILRLMAEGKGNAEIARELFISPNTVRKHASQIFRKLRVQNRVQAAVRAAPHSLLEQ